MRLLSSDNRPLTSELRFSLTPGHIKWKKEKSRLPSAEGAIQGTLRLTRAKSIANGLTKFFTIPVARVSL